MQTEQTTTTAADPARAWSAVAEVTTWPRWTASMTSVEPLDGAGDGDGLRVGDRYRIRQPAMAPLVWQVTEVSEGESFVWTARSPGVRTVAYHRVERDPDGATRITIGLRQTGPLAWLVGLVVGGRIRRYVGMESAGLKAASEATSPSPA